MNFAEKNNSETQKKLSEDGNVLHDIDAIYLSVENQRIKEAILKTDTDKFLVFTRMLRINAMLKNAKVTHHKSL